MSVQSKLEFKDYNLQSVDWKLIARIQSQREDEAKERYYKQRAGAYHSLYLQSQKKIKELEEKLKQNGKTYQI